jgi:hypothetical protein
MPCTRGMRSRDSVRSRSHTLYLRSHILYLRPCIIQNIAACVTWLSMQLWHLFSHLVFHTRAIHFHSVHHCIPAFTCIKPELSRTNCCITRNNCHTCGTSSSECLAPTTQTPNEHSTIVRYQVPDVTIQNAVIVTIHHVRQHRTRRMRHQLWTSYTSPSERIVNAPRHECHVSRSWHLTICVHICNDVSNSSRLRQTT